MSKVFSSSVFINKLYWLVNDVSNIYASGKGIWCTYYDKKWRMDCVCSIKGILWGFSANKKKSHGGAIYKSNGVADFTCNGALNYCSAVSKNFKNITPGEYLCMKGTKYNHSGIYLGDGKVFECTTGWGVNKCIVSRIDDNGIRSYNGKKNLKWTYHGKLDYIDYTNDDLNNKTIDELAKEVIEGKWGNGSLRKRLLGDKYRIVQDRVNELLKKDNTKYLSNKSYKGCSIVDALNQIKVNSSYSNRAKLAKINGIKNYVGSAKQNIKLLNLLKSGTLKAN